MSQSKSDKFERLIKGVGLGACAVGLIGAGWIVGQRDSIHEIAKLNGEIDAMVNDQVETCLVKQVEGESGEEVNVSDSKLANYDFGSLVCNTPEQAQILMTSPSLQKRIVGRICSESL